MTDLNHWDYADEFTAGQAAALIQGLDPNEPGFEWWKARPVLDRIKAAYSGAMLHHRINFESLLDLDDRDDPEDTELQCVAMTLRGDWYRAWMGTIGAENIELQKFARSELARWLKATGLPSAYQFDRVRAKHESAANADARDLDCDAFDPSGLPEELGAANIAYRAVTNGYGERSDTFKQRLIAFLKERYPTLGDQAIERVATVANPDKVPGRRRRNEESTAI